MQRKARFHKEEQILVIVFVHHHGSIKEMERMFGVSYPTVKNLMKVVGNRFEYVEINPLTLRLEILTHIRKEVTTVEQV